MSMTSKATNSEQPYTKPIFMGSQKTLAKNNRSDTSLPCFFIGKRQEEKIKRIFEQFCDVKPYQAAPKPHDP